CGQCGQRFAQRASLVEHGRRHTGERPHRCPQCHRAFRQRSALLRHRRAHAGERALPC
ncbi:ZN154 protein, partial [Rynchops niger]|nr:ZN154 protein [Rynchops niger]